MLIVQLFVRYAHVNLCHFFSSFWCRGLAAASACGSSWTFLFTVCTFFSNTGYFVFFMTSLLCKYTSNTIDAKQRL